MYKDITKIIQENERKIFNLSSETEVLKKHLERFPDLVAIDEKYTGRHGHLCSEKVNSIVTDVVFCYNEDGVEAQPYLKTEFGWIFSNPHYFLIGKAHWIHGTIPEPGWKDLLKKHNISETIINQIDTELKFQEEERIQILKEELEPK